MIRYPVALAASASVVFAACGGSASFSFPDGTSPSPVTAASQSDAATSTPVSTPVSTQSGADASTTPPDPASNDAGAPVFDATTNGPDDAAPPSPLQPDAGSILDGLRSITAKCTVASNGTYATDRSASAAIDICKLNGAFFWTADLAIDCDGQKTTACNSTTDSTFSAQTSIAQSNGQPLIASELPYVVIPLPSSRFDYTKENVPLGALAIVLYGDQVMYGVLGDEGPTGVIGEASYAMAASLGLDPTPKTGGTSGPVTYIVLTGKSAVVSPVESHGAAVTLSTTLVPQLIANN